MQPIKVKDSNEEYHSKNEFISSSNIAGVRTLKEYYYNKFQKPKIQRDYFEIGTAAHAYILEPDLFLNKIIIFDKWPEPNKLNQDGTVTKKGANLSALNEFKEANRDKIVFEKSIYHNVLNYANSFYQFPDFEKLFNIKTGETEISFYGEEKETGLKVKIRPDYIKPWAFIGDLKFEKDISQDSIIRSFKDYEYHVRAAFIIDNYNHFTGESIDKFIFAFAEKKEPFHCRILELSQRDLMCGREIYRTRLEKIKEATETGIWPGFEKKSGNESIELLELPDWVYKGNLF